MAVGCLGVSVAELDQLDGLVFRDARTHKSCDAVDMLLHTWATPAGSDLPPVLLEGGLSHANLCLRFVFVCFLFDVSLVPPRGTENLNKSIHL